MFYVGTFRLPVLADPTANPPFYLQNDIRTQVASSMSQVVIRDGIPPDALNPDVITGRSLVGVWPFNFRNGMTNQWNINIQQSLPGNSLVSFAYVGSNTVHTESGANLNQPEPGPGGINPRRWFPQFANITTNPAIGGRTTRGSRPSSSVASAGASLS